MSDQRKPVSEPDAPSTPLCAAMCPLDGTGCILALQHEGAHKCRRGGEWLGDMTL